MIKARLEEALSILGAVDGDWAVQNLRNQVPTIIEHLVYESTNGKSDGNWREQSVRLLRPRCKEDSITYCKEMLRTYNQILNVYDHLVKTGKHETLDMARFRDDIAHFARFSEMMGRVYCAEEIKA